MGYSYLWDLSTIFHFLRNAFTLAIFATYFSTHSLIKCGNEYLPPRSHFANSGALGAPKTHDTMTQKPTLPVAACARLENRATASLQTIFKYIIYVSISD